MTWDIFADSLPELLAAAGGTLRMTAFAFLFAALLGLALAILRLAGGLTGRVAFLYIEIVRGMPALALLFLIYFGLAPLGLVLNSFVAAVVAFGLNGAAYLAEVYRAGIQAVDPGQREAAQMLGLRRWIGRLTNFTDLDRVRSRPCLPPLVGTPWFLCKTCIRAKAASFHCSFTARPCTT